jgi:hypothetical protein
MEKIKVTPFPNTLGVAPTSVFVEICGSPTGLCAANSQRLVVHQVHTRHLFEPCHRFKRRSKAGALPWKVVHAVKSALRDCATASGHAAHDADDLVKFVPEFNLEVKVSNSSVPYMPSWLQDLGIALTAAPKDADGRIPVPRLSDIPQPWAVCKVTSTQPAQFYRVDQEFRVWTQVDKTWSKTVGCCMDFVCAIDSVKKAAIMQAAKAAFLKQVPKAAEYGANYKSCLSTGLVPVEILEVTRMAWNFGQTSAENLEQAVCWKQMATLLKERYAAKRVKDAVALMNDQCLEVTAALEVASGMAAKQNKVFKV